MSELFKPYNLGSLELPNRVVRSATYEGMAYDNGDVTEELIKLYDKLARGSIGLIISGYMYVHPWGKTFRHQTGIYDDRQVRELAGITHAVHEQGGKIVFQLAHAGRQTTKKVSGMKPGSPSKVKRDMTYGVKPRALTYKEIVGLIDSFVTAAIRSVKAHADGIQLHAAHGYMLNQFLSPFFNRRTDAWGDNAKKRFRLLKEIITEIKAVVPKYFPILVKLNAHDYTPGEGVTPELAVQYARWLEELGVDAIEVSCGTGSFSFMTTCRGDVPVDDLVASQPAWRRFVARKFLTKMEGKYTFKEPYNLKAAKAIKEALTKTKVIAVGGIRTTHQMEDILDMGLADMVALSRPFIREPKILKRLESGKKDKVTCVSCNKCLAATVFDIPVRCYVNGIPGR